MFILIFPRPTIVAPLSYVSIIGRRLIWPAVAGNTFGDLVTMSLALTGLDALLATSALAFAVFNWLGAVYLIWLGLTMLRTTTRPTFDAISPQTQTTPQNIFHKLFWVTALNPKSNDFFTTFLPIFIDPSHPVVAQSLIMLATFVICGALNALNYGYARTNLELV